MRKRISMRIMDMGAGQRLGLAAALAVLLWCTVWWAV